MNLRSAIFEAQKISRREAHTVYVMLREIPTFAIGPEEYRKCFREGYKPVAAFRAGKEIMI